MAKPWAEVVESKGYQALPDEEKSAVQEQYFSSVVAPKVPEQDRDAVRAQFFSSAVVPKSKIKSAAPANDNPMGDDLGAAIMGAAAPRDKKTYTGSVFDTQPFNPPFDPKEAARLSRKDYAEQSMKPPRRQPPEMRALSEEEASDRSAFRTGTDLVAGATQGGIGFLKGIVQNIPAEDPLGLGALEQRFENIKTPQLRGSAMARQGVIQRARENQGELAASRAAFNTMFSPAGADIVAKGAGSMIPTLGMSLGGLSLKAMTAANALSNAGDAANQVSEQLKGMKPEEWSNNEVYQSLREKGLSHRDAVNMLAPIYALPAQAVGFGTGYLSGRTGLEKGLAGKAKGSALGRGASELAGEELETLGPMAVGNLTAGAIDDRTKIQQGLGQAAIETAAGSLPGSAMSAAIKEAPTRAPIADALNPLKNAQELAQTLPEQPAPAAEQEVQATPEPKSRSLNDLAEQIAIERGVPLKNAMLLAQRRLDEATADKVEELAQVYVDLGVPRKKARVQAAIDIAKEEELAATERDATGEADVGQPIADASGVSPELAGQPNQVKPAEGFGEPATDGVVSAGENVAPIDAGEAVQPSALKFTTAKGSVYVVGADGKTSRTKNSEGRGQGTTYEPHMALYVQPGDHTEILSDMQGGRGANSVRLGYVENNTFTPVENMADIPEGVQPFVGVFNKKKGTPVGMYPAEVTPQVGLHPVEKLYTPDGNANTHIGNAIVDVQPVEQPAPTPAPEITIEPAFRTTKGGKDVSDGYDVFINGEWGNRYPTKKAAQAAVQEAQAAQATTPTQQGAQVGTETPQAVKAKTKKQKAAAAGVTTPLTKAEREAEETKKLDDAYNRAQFIVNRSSTPSTLLKGVSLLRAAAAAKYYFTKAMAGGPDFMYLANGVKNSIPALTTTYELTGKMSGMAADFLRAAGLMQTRVDDYLTKFPEKKEPLGTMIYTATVMRYDPADTKRKRRNVAMDTQFAELGEEGQKVYVALRDYYRDVADYYNDLLLESIENLGIDPEEKKNLAILLRREYEASKRISPYFPLVRLGDFWLRVGTGEDRELYTFESVGKRNEFAAEMAKEFGDDLDTLIGEETFAMGTQLNFRQESSKGNAMLTALFDAIDRQPTTANDEEAATNRKETMKNVVFQAYLSAMPEQSYRKQFMEREDIPGFSRDITKNIAHTATRQALQLARMKYAPEIRRSLDEARRSLKYQPKGYDLEPYVDEAETRANLLLTGNDTDGLAASAVTGINQVSYVFLLSGPATALMDVINVPTRGLSVLGANHSNFAGATVELSKALSLANRITEKRMHKNEEGVPTMLDDPALSKEMRYAIGELMRSDVTQQTEVESLRYLGAKDTDVTAGPVKKTAQKIGRGASAATLGFSHYMSKLTREIVFTASYNLSRKEGKSPDEAIRIAIAETKEALGDFAIGSRPRYMQGELGRLAFNLKSFMVNTLLFEVVNLKRMIKADSKEEQVAAAKKFLGLWATTALALGQPATPLYTVIMGTLGVVFESLKSDGWPEDMKAMNFEMWYRTIWIPQHLGDGLGGFMNHGLLGYTGWDLTYRASLDVVKQLMDWSQSLTPPGISVMVNMYEGMKKWERGDVEEGMKKMLPAILRGPYLSYLMATQGEKDSRGNQLVKAEDIKLYEHAGQVLGFRPRVIGQIRRDNFELMNIEKNIVKERFDLLDRLDIADRNKDSKAYRKTYEKIDEFNQKYDGYKIELQDMVDSANERERKRAASYRGIELTKKNEFLLGRPVDNTRRELGERQRKRLEKE
jgi:hypothetical protein